ncbi:hypothetical protein [Marinagarivorans cellulosilyticus]|uniref:Cellulose-binding protein n=1 Tax=Marinagarivorans cellulosilyticus TaxID=2721545 RepID=A0AAN1WI88_9GAMM|nr:hypothetical protein [Marinagarivorans cellulosilyticus]BCD98067.1 hypothetical protein MARGE09_P2268 [Marinagarivorans cellulosilyticus]
MQQNSENGSSSTRQPLVFLALFVLALALPTLAQPTEQQAKPTASNKVLNPSMGIGLKGISDWSTQLPFIDLMRQSREWKDWRNKQSTKPIHTDENDWIMKLERGQTLGTVFLTSNESPLYQHYVVFYEGDGIIDYRWAAKKNTEKSRQGVDYITVKKGAALLEVTRVNPKKPITNISIVAVEHLPHWQQGEIFNPDWIKRISQFRALRYMDWLRTNNSKPYTWRQRPQMKHRRWTKNGVPLEVISLLSNKLNSIPWINIPHWADSVFTGNIASVFHHHLSPELPIYIEHSNEVWNWSFKQSHYALAQGAALWEKEGNAFMQWHGMRTAEICNTFKKGAFKDNPERIICTLGVQTGWRGLASAALECPLWAKAPCFKHGLDALAITTYFDAGLSGPSKKNIDQIKPLKNLINHPNSINMAFQQINTGSVIPTQRKQKAYRGLKEATASSVKYWANVAKEYNLSLVAYEGGQHITANGKALQDDKDTIVFHQAVNKDPRMKDTYSTMLAEWKNNGGGLHMHFVDISSSSKWGSWGALEHVKQESSPKWDALMEFNTDHPCWWSQCQQFPIAKEVSPQ